MEWYKALILGIIQGLTEFLPVSSSGHLEIGHRLFGQNEYTENITFAIVVHGATVLSTIFVFYREIVDLLRGFFKIKWNWETKYIVKIAISMIPVSILGLFFMDEIDKLFTGDMHMVGAMLMVTALLLTFSYFTKPKDKEVTYFKSFIIGIAQAIAVIPGISRSGSTIATGLLLGVKRENAAKFSFLMVLVPIILANVKDVIGTDLTEQRINAMPLIIGFVSAFISGLLACKWMLRIVKKGKLIYFAIYCAVVGVLALFLG